MSRGARNAVAINSRALAEFRRQLLQLQTEFDVSAERIVSRMADVGLAATKKATPVGEYSSEVRFITKSGKVVRFTTGIKKQGGTLRRGWIKSVTHKDGNTWKSGYTNNVEYGLYVNEGHRIVRNGVTVGYQPGVHMLETGTRAAERALPALFKAEIARIMGKTGF